MENQEIRRTIVNRTLFAAARGDITQDQGVQAIVTATKRNYWLQATVPAWKQRLITEFGALHFHLSLLGSSDFRWNGLQKSRSLR